MDDFTSLQFMPEDKLDDIEFVQRARLAAFLPLNRWLVDQMTKWDFKFTVTLEEKRLQPAQCPGHYFEHERGEVIFFTANLKLN